MNFTFFVDFVLLLFHCVCAFARFAGPYVSSVSTVVRRVGAPYRRARIPGSSDLCACEVSANEDIAL